MCAEVILKFQLLAIIHVQIKSDSAVSINIPPLSPSFPLPPPPLATMGIWLSFMPRCGKFEHCLGGVGNLNLWNTFLWFNFKHVGFSRKGVHFHKQIFTSKNNVYKQRTQQQGKKLNLLKFYRIHWSHKELFKEKIVLELIGNWTQFSPWARRGGLFEWTNLQKLKCSRGYLGGGCWSFLLLSA